MTPQEMLSTAIDIAVGLDRVTSEFEHITDTGARDSVVEFVKLINQYTDRLPKDSSHREFVGEAANLILTSIMRKHMECPGCAITIGMVSVAMGIDPNSFLPKTGRRPGTFRVMKLR